MQTEACHDDDLLMRQWENTAPSGMLQPCREDTGSGTLLPQSENNPFSYIQPVEVTYVDVTTTMNSDIQLTVTLTDCFHTSK